MSEQSKTSPAPSSSSSSSCSYPPTLLSALHAQRGDDGSSGFCDVLVKCGQQTSPAHSCVLAAASGFFHRVLVKMRRTGDVEAPQRHSSLLLLEVDDLFVGVEHLFLDILSFLYLGRQGPALNEEVLGSLAAKLDLRPWKKAKRMEEEEAREKGKSQVEKKKRRKTSRRQEEEEQKEEEEVESFLGMGDDCKMDISFCRKCDLLFISKEEFLAHRMLDCTRKFTCKTCGSMFTRVQSLLEHLAEVRHGETICSVCLLALPSSVEMEAHLARHLARTDRPYFCHKCESRFATINALAQHLPKHSSETPFVCQVCNKGFKWKHALTSHMNVHSSEKKFLCHDCGFATCHASVLKNHQRIHTGQTLKCSFPSCTFQTIRKQNLVQHQLTHSKEKAHQCDVCGKAFSLVKNMRRHQKQHDGKASRHKCQVAGCTFSTLRSDKFVQHIRRHEQAGDLVGGAGVDVVAAAGATSGISAAATIAKDTAGSLRSVLDIVNPPNKTVNLGTVAAGTSSSSTVAHHEAAFSSSGSYPAESAPLSKAHQSLGEVSLPTDLVVLGKDLDLLATVASAPASRTQAEFTS